MNHLKHGCQNLASQHKEEIMNKTTKENFEQMISENKFIEISLIPNY